jgi:hypothetical protein
MHSRTAEWRFARYLFVISIRQGSAYRAILISKRGCATSARPCPAALPVYARDRSAVAAGPVRRCGERIAAAEKAPHAQEHVRAKEGRPMLGMLDYPSIRQPQHLPEYQVRVLQWHRGSYPQLCPNLSTVP